MHPLFLCDAQLKEFQQKSSPTSVGGEKGGGAGAKKKRKVKGLGQNDATSADRSSPDNVSHSFSICLPACPFWLCNNISLYLIVCVCVKNLTD